MYRNMLICIKSLILKIICVSIIYKYAIDYLNVTLLILFCDNIFVLNV